MKKTLAMLLALSSIAATCAMPEEHSFTPKERSFKKPKPLSDAVSRSESADSKDGKRTYRHYIMRSKRQKNDEQDNRPMHRKHRYGHTMKKDQK